MLALVKSHMNKIIKNLDLNPGPAWFGTACLTCEPINFSFLNCKMRIMILLHKVLWGLMKWCNGFEETYMEPRKWEVLNISCLLFHPQYSINLNRVLTKVIGSKKGTKCENWESTWKSNNWTAHEQVCEARSERTANSLSLHLSTSTNSPLIMHSFVPLSSLPHEGETNSKQSVVWRR